MSRPLKEEVKEYFAGFEISEQQLRSLQEREAEAHQENRKKVLLNWGSLAVSMVTLILVVSYFYTTSTNEFNLKSLPSEISYHHNKQMNSKIMTSSISKMRKSLSKLDFSLITSEKLPPSKWKIIGGRYCSLQGRLAAQIKVKNLKKNKEYTLYQMARPPELEGPVESFQEFHNGAKVKIWSENGLLLGMAGSH